MWSHADVRADGHSQYPDGVDSLCTGYYPRRMSCVAPSLPEDY